MAHGRNAMDASGFPSDNAWSDLTRLVGDHHAALYRYAYRLSGNAADAEDLTQQVFLIAQQKLDQVRDAECVRGWLYTVLRNSYLCGKRRPTPVASTDIEFNLEQVPDEAADDENREFDGELLQIALNELPDNFKLVVTMFYFEDCSYKQIADRLDLPIGTVMSRLSRAKGTLRTRLLRAAGAATTTNRVSRDKKKRPIQWTS